MRLTFSILVGALCWTARLATAAYVYTFDPESLPSDAERPQTLSPIEARLVLAQRAGVEDYHTDDLIKSGAIEAINRFGVQEPLFGAGVQQVRRKVQILVELEDGDSEGAVAFPNIEYSHHFAISPDPSSASTRSLFLDLARQRWTDTFSHLSDADLIDAIQKATVSHDQAGNEMDDAAYIVRKPSMQAFEDFWRDLIYLARTREAANDYSFAYSLTAIVISSSDSASYFDSGKAVWGHYSLPSHIQFQKRQQETPLEPTSSTATSTATSTLRQTATSSPIAPLAQEPLPGILPACFSTRLECRSQTRNCTGHGQCELMWTDRDHEDRNEPCYACQCRPTIQNTTDSEGNVRSLTIVWGGPACQKRDVSQPFWLIAGITVGIVGLISFAIGSLMDCGSETLPSVIGAGVSGPGVRGRG